MSRNLPHIMPSPQPEVEEIFVAHQTTHQFYHEVQTRSEFKQHCEWYHSTAQRNRQDMERMRGEINFFQFFRRK
ncbi:MAG: hypothetical protein PUP92_23805 [Rhizonema sp. PD38]|nr:hypothetical protein [Rhizonema sp. PD38]